MNAELLANLSHDLRTPLNGILGFTEFLLDEKPGPLNPRQKEYLGDVLSCGQQLLQLINDVSDLSKVETGRMPLRIETFSLPGAIGEALGAVSHAAAAKRVTLRRYVDPGLGMITLDRGKLMQVLYNLLSNAVKLTDSGEVSLDVTLEIGDELKLQVCNSGIGADSSGLGLTLTRKLIQFQGGTIEVHSEDGRGSIVTVSLPVQIAG
jgi:signal transduction histidine kinase